MIEREQIIAKAREVEDAVNQTKAAAQNTAVLAGVAVVAFVVLAYTLGKRKNKPAKTVVEVYRVK